MVDRRRQWIRCLRRVRSWAARALGSPVRIPIETRIYLSDSSCVPFCVVISPLNRFPVEGKGRVVTVLN
jgi:hypothetical protein